MTLCVYIYLHIYIYLTTVSYAQGCEDSSRNQHVVRSFGLPIMFICFVSLSDSLEFNNVTGGHGCFERQRNLIVLNFNTKTKKIPSSI